MKENIDTRLRAIVRELVSNGITYEQATTAFEAKLIDESLALNRWNVTRTAQKLNVHRNTLHNKIASHGSLLSQTPARNRKSRRR